MSSVATPFFDHIIDGLAGPGYAVTPDFFAPSLIETLSAEAHALRAEGQMRQASTGTGPKAGTSISLRGDFIHWLEAQTASPAQQVYIDTMAELRSELNRTLYLGLFEMESHFAIYPPGAVYQKHLDQFKGKEDRQVSCILYLNQQWQPADDGGSLRMYLDGAAATPYLDIPPMGGTLVTFLSGQFLHEVLPASRTRTSLTGWMRRRSDLAA